MCGILAVIIVIILIIIITVNNNNINNNNNNIISVYSADCDAVSMLTILYVILLFFCNGSWAAD